MDTRSTFGARLRQLRASRGFSQQKLAARLNVAQQTVGKWEKEITSPDPDMLADICRALGCSSDYLLGLTDDAPQTVGAGAAEQLTSDDVATLKRVARLIDSQDIRIYKVARGGAGVIEVVDADEKRAINELFDEAD